MLRAKHTSLMLGRLGRCFCTLILLPFLYHLNNEIVAFQKQYQAGLVLFKNLYFQTLGSFIHFLPNCLLPQGNLRRIFPQRRFFCFLQIFRGDGTSEFFFKNLDFISSLVNTERVRLKMIFENKVNLLARGEIYMAYFVPPAKWCKSWQVIFFKKPIPEYQIVHLILYN